MKILARTREAVRKLIFCYTVTKNLPSFLKLIWFTKLYRLRKKSLKYKKLRHKFFSISMAESGGRKIFLRIYAGDIDIFYEIFFSKVYELPSTPGKRVIIDAGANVGFAALYFFQQIPNAIIYCIEPDHDNFVFLQKNLQTEISAGKVIPLEAALAFEDGIIKMKEGAFKYNTAITGEGENSFSAQTYTVLSFLKKFNIKNADLFKIDIEGAEEKIFAGDISWLKNISEIIIEFHSKGFKATCFEKLKSENFSYVPHGIRLHTEVFHFVH